MSKKPAKSERDVELPDWADDVTPADEVMRKFYAPTGAFKAGPIVVQPPGVSAVPEPAPVTKESGEKGSPAPTEPLKSTVDAPEEGTPTASARTDAAVKEDQKSGSSLPLADLKAPTPPEENVVAVVPDTTDKPTQKAPVEIPSDAQNQSFEEFARKWRRYLYPGQMAVMRTLFDLTVARGTSECFTRYSELATATKMTRRNCINVMNSLVDRGFVKRLEVRNDATGKGIKLRVYAEPLP
jgi:hypothetical protein